LFRAEYALYAPPAASPAPVPGAVSGVPGGSAGGGGGAGRQGGESAEDRWARLQARMAASQTGGGVTLGQGAGRTDEVLAYFLAPVADAGLRDSALLAWWATQTSQFPTLARMARDFLAMQASSAACERQFSGSRWVVRPTRSSLRGPAIRALMCLDDWLPRAQVRALEAEHHRAVSGVRAAAAAAAAAAEWERGGGSDRWDDLLDPVAEGGHGTV
jgi:hypothetical protein